MFSSEDNKSHADSSMAIANPEVMGALFVNTPTVKGIDHLPTSTIKGAVVTAARNGLHEYMVGLLHAGAGDVNEVYQKETPLYCASSRGDANMVQTLLSFGAVPDDPHRAPRRIALHAAARYIRWCNFCEGRRWWKEESKRAYADYSPGKTRPTECAKEQHG